MKQFKYRYLKTIPNHKKNTTKQFKQNKKLSNWWIKYKYKDTLFLTAEHSDE